MTLTLIFRDFALASAWFSRHLDPLGCHNMKHPVWQTHFLRSSDDAEFPYMDGLQRNNCGVSLVHEPSWEPVAPMKVRSLSSLVLVFVLHPHFLLFFGSSMSPRLSSDSFTCSRGRKLTRWVLIVWGTAVKDMKKSHLSKATDCCFHYLPPGQQSMIVRRGRGLTVSDWLIVPPAPCGGL